LQLNNLCIFATQSLYICNTILVHLQHNLGTFATQSLYICNTIFVYYLQHNRRGWLAFFYYYLAFIISERGDPARARKARARGSHLPGRVGEPRPGCGQVRRTRWWRRHGLARLGGTGGAVALACMLTIDCLFFLLLGRFPCVIALCSRPVRFPHPVWW
jgi:hypothetical protein